MTTTTAETLTVDGTVLNTYAKNIETRTGRMHVPGLRTPNVALPGKHGDGWTKYKTYEPGVLVLNMWVLGCDDDGLIPGGSTARKEFIKNRDALLQLFMASQSLRTLKQTMPDGSVRQCRAEVLTAFDFSSINPTDARFSVEFAIPEVFWESETYTTDSLIALTAEAGAGSDYSDVTFLDGSNAPIEDLIFKVHGPATNPTLWDAWTGQYVRLNAALGSGSVWTVNSGLWTTDVDGTNVVASVQSVGESPRLLVLNPYQAGPPRIKVVANGGTWVPGTSTLKISGRRKFLVA